MSAALESLRKNQDLRIVTDRQVSTAWVLLPIAIALTIIALVFYVFALVFAALGDALTNPGASPPSSVFAAAFAGLGAIFGVVLLLQILYAYFFYILIRRRNQHFARQQHFVADLVSVLREAAAKKGVNIEALLLSMESSNRQAQVEEGEKSAALWAILLLVPVLSIVAFLYIFYFLTGDYYQHERREDGMLSDVQRAFSSVGVQFVFHRNEPVPHRSFVVYLVAALLTFGVFELYWMYTFIRDPNHHFSNHAAFEGTVVQLASPLLA
ncbi:MAG: DUF4234 domain-containing protein [Thaumarchaeota archaeon]|nr:DUF4234 domain-containing protein [Nitrososphaerota archaeon]